MTLPLDGITVLDFSTLLPGPLATFMLAEAGAEVIKVERPGGEDMRAFPPRLRHRLRRLRDAERRQDQHRRRSEDRRGTCEAPAADRARRRARRAVPARRHGAARARLRRCPGDQPSRGLLLDLGLRPGRTAVAGGGARHQLPGPHRPVVLVSWDHRIARASRRRSSPTSPAASFPAVINILLALRRRDLTGEGCRIDIAMTDAMFTFAWLALARGLRGRAFPGITGEHARRRLAALRALRHGGRQVPRRRGARAEVLGRLLPRHRLARAVARRPPRSRRHPRRDHRPRAPEDGGRVARKSSSRSTAARRSSARSRRRSPIRSSATAGCSRPEPSARTGRSMPAVAVPIAADLRRPLPSRGRFRRSESRRGERGGRCQMSRFAA